MEVQSLGITEKELPIYKYLEKFFDLEYHIGSSPEILIDHKTPNVKFGSLSLPLLYPKGAVEKCLEYYSKRSIDFMFQGLIPSHRKPSLDKWRDRAVILPTDKGRKGITRYWDENYLKLLSITKFSLCPNGGYPWTYRFFESILCGATPIVQRKLPLYDGFYYHMWNDTNFEHINTEENFQLAYHRLTIDPKVIQNQLTAQNNPLRT